MKLNKNGFPRRSTLEAMTPEETAIYNCIQAVEMLGAHPLLTECVIKLGEAKDKLSDWIDSQPDPTDSMKPGQNFYMIERRDHPELRPHSWLYLTKGQYGFAEWIWTQDPNLALHFTDLASAKQFLVLMGHLDVVVTSHTWMDREDGFTWKRK
jgi:hypothetical protein